MKGRYFLKWLFLTVLSVSVLHFREANPADRLKIEQVAIRQNLHGEKAFHFQHFKPYGNPCGGFAHFKHAQYLRFSFLSIELSDLSAKRRELGFYRASNRVHTQNQHFRSRRLLADDHSILHS